MMYRHEGNSLIWYIQTSKLLMDTASVVGENKRGNNYTHTLHTHTHTIHTESQHTHTHTIHTHIEATTTHASTQQHTHTHTQS